MDDIATHHGPSIILIGSALLELRQGQQAGYNAAFHGQARTFDTLEEAKVALFHCDFELYKAKYPEEFEAEEEFNRR